MSITKKMIEKQISCETGITQIKVEKVVNSLLRFISEALLNGETVMFTGFGAFKPVKRAPKKGRDFQKGKALLIKPRIIPLFIPCNDFKREFNKRT